jgi:hypothetical protein
MIYRWILILFIVSSLFAGCDIQERERAVQKKDQELAVKEQQLKDRELALQKAEAAFALKQQLDSTHADSLFVYQQNIAGTWSTSMTCTETTCSGSAVGDIKKEVWTFLYEQSRIVAKATVDENVARIYTGQVVNNGIELVQTIEPTTTGSAATIRVRIKKVNDNTMEGEREIIREGCKIVYSLQLTR